jgi:hypothetical protein
MRYNVHLLITFSVAVSLCALVTGAHAATHQLSLNPVRTVFTDKKRTATVRINNPTSHALGYSLSIITMRKNSEGNWVEADTENEEDILIKKMIRFAPRRAVIQPGKRQLVKMLLRKPKDLPVGEYRAWLHLVPITVDGNGEGATTVGESESRGIRMDVVVNSNFPIIIQNGNIHSEMVPESIVIQSPDGQKNYRADITLRREGDASIFGSLEVKYYGSGASEGRKVGRASEIAMYLSENSKIYSLPLKNISGAELTSGLLEVNFQPVIRDGSGKQFQGKPAVSRKFSCKPLPANDPGGTSLSCLGDSL